MTVANPTCGWKNNTLLVPKHLYRATTLTGQTPFTNGASGASPAVVIDLKNGWIQVLSMTSLSGTPTVSFTNGFPGNPIAIQMQNDNNGFPTMTLTGSVLMEGGISKTLNLTPRVNCIDWLIGIYDGTSYYFSFKRGWG